MEKNCIHKSMLSRKYPDVVEKSTVSSLLLMSKIFSTEKDSYFIYSGKHPSTDPSSLIATALLATVED